jgi:hypothetical protein
MLGAAQQLLNMSANRPVGSATFAALQIVDQICLNFKLDIH